jgi:hypothetical protein
MSQSGVKQLIDRPQVDRTRCGSDSGRMRAPLRKATFAECGGRASEGCMSPRWPVSRLAWRTWASWSVSSLVGQGDAGSVAAGGCSHAGRSAASAPREQRRCSCGVESRPPRPTTAGEARLRLAGEARSAGGRSLPGRCWRRLRAHGARRTNSTATRRQGGRRPSWPSLPRLGRARAEQGRVVWHLSGLHRRAVHRLLPSMCRSHLPVTCSVGGTVTVARFTPLFTAMLTAMFTPPVSRLR